MHFPAGSNSRGLAESVTGLRTPAATNLNFTIMKKKNLFIDELSKRICSNPEMLKKVIRLQKIILDQRAKSSQPGNH